MKMSVIHILSVSEVSEAAVMRCVEELNHTAQLRRVGFGRPPPRHGLHLLHWFCSEALYVHENDQMIPRCDPEEGDFGFHLFENRFYQNGLRLLPNINFPYYVVGNLNSDGSEQLPPYVTQAYTGLHDDSNKDRIIVSLRNGRFHKVYITEHRDEWNYNPNKTYCINKRLIKYISQRNQAEFLTETGVRPTVNFIPQRQETHITINNSNEQEAPRSSGFWDYCTIL